MSAQNNETLDVIYNVYNKVFNAGIIKASSIKTAEAAKMYENVQRDVLIALANQYSEYCLTEGLNIKEHMQNYELSSDAANSLIEISYLSSYL